MPVEWEPKEVPQFRDDVDPHAGQRVGRHIVVVDVEVLEIVEVERRDVKEGSDRDVLDVDKRTKPRPVEIENRSVIVYRKFDLFRREGIQDGLHICVDKASWRERRRAVRVAVFPATE